MFEIGWSEILVIAVVAVVVIGPKDLPRALRVVGQWTGKIKRMARDFQGQFNEAIREAELDSVQRDIEAIGKIDPMADIREAAAKTADDIRRDLDKAGQAAVAMPPREPYPWEVSAPPETVAPVSIAPTEPAAPAAPVTPVASPQPAAVEPKP